MAFLSEPPDLFHLLIGGFGSSDGQILLKRGIEDHHILHGGHNWGRPCSKEKWDVYHWLHKRNLQIRLTLFLLTKMQLRWCVRHVWDYTKTQNEENSRNKLVNVAAEWLQCGYIWSNVAPRFQALQIPSKATVVAWIWLMLILLLMDKISASIEMANSYTYTHIWYTIQDYISIVPSSRNVHGLRYHGHTITEVRQGHMTHIHTVEEDAAWSKWPISETRRFQWSNKLYNRKTM